MAKKTLYSIGILLTIIIGSILYYNYCSNCKIQTPVNVTLPDSTASLAVNGLKLKAESLDYQCTSNFDFIRNGFNALLPVSDSVNTGLENLKAYVAKNPNIKILITGYAKSDEKNTSVYSNLGEARAVNVKNYIESKGFVSSMFDTKGEIIDTWKLRGDTVLGPVNFTISKADSVKTDWNAVKEKINANPLVLYFETGQSEIDLTPEQRQEVDEVVEYLDHVEAGSLSIVGYTDNTGKRESNIKLGSDRAGFLKGYFVKNGISADKIKTSSKGQDEPIADNTTSEGKAKNRRTVVTIH